MFGHRIKIDDELFDNIKKCVALAGYSSTGEFVTHVLEREVQRLLGSSGQGPESEEELRKRLQGLGYIE
ncbi:MAG: hypothetical protein A3D93_02840 [Acidobacteria bacterium RIFCSPHIGHO2_12_FULL_67_30]|nr:MAG: hypothetical protein A2620_00985 [Acidobacteria bacterium RIFCSPHIGHO2_01_FULL_67_28]OFV87622.1 MAG: hypothetical protein A3D93_02840 [Acidobacteria bacterium RIFCSPHIGHO2_12_FULL_67_30]